MRSFLVIQQSQKKFLVQALRMSMPECTPIQCIRPATSSFAREMLFLLEKISFHISNLPVPLHAGSMKNSASRIRQYFQNRRHSFLKRRQFLGLTAARSEEHTSELQSP